MKPYYSLPSVFFALVLTGLILGLTVDNYLGLAFIGMAVTFLGGAMLGTVNERSYPSGPPTDAQVYLREADALLPQRDDLPADSAWYDAIESWRARVRRSGAQERPDSDWPRRSGW